MGLVSTAECMDDGSCPGPFSGASPEISLEGRSDALSPAFSPAARFAGSSQRNQMASRNPKARVIQEDASGRNTRFQVGSRQLTSPQFVREIG